jgi:peptidoglycan-N-acetylglucosamine deacetylase
MSRTTLGRFWPTRNREPANRVALTFDDGPSEWTEPILEILSAHGAHATFFVIGNLAQRRADLVRRMVTDGHEVGNHTWSHPRLAEDCDDARVREELVRTNEVLTEILGFPPNRFRAPRYNLDERVLAVASTLGLNHTPGHVTPGDWEEDCTPKNLATFVLQGVRPDAIIGMHDGTPLDKPRSAASHQATVDAVAMIVPRLRKRGFRCVTASQLLNVSTER